MMFQCLASVENVGPTLKKYWMMPRVCWGAGTKYTADPVLK